MLNRKSTKAPDRCSGPHDVLWRNQGGRDPPTEVKGEELHRRNQVRIVVKQRYVEISGELVAERRISDK